MRPSFVALSINLSESSGKHVLQEIATIAKNSLTPIAIVSHHDTIENRILAYSIGATDFIAKPVKLELFLPYLKNRLALKREIQSSITIDELTWAFNRKSMDPFLSNSIAAFNRYKDIFSLVMLDLDHFKNINDTYGHLEGDIVLRELVTTINKWKRDTDYLFRFGGEEFLLLLPYTSAEEARVLVERIREAFMKIEFAVGEEKFFVTFSAGIVAINKQNNERDKILEEVDQALYKSKASGRNCTTIYTNGYSNVFLKNLHIIIVEKNIVVRKVLARDLSKWEFTKDMETKVELYEDGKSFLESSWYRRGNKYVILLDETLSDINGMSVLGKIRHTYPEEDIVICMLAPRSEEDHVIHLFQEGADDIILKPINVAELIARVERLVERLSV